VKMEAGPLREQIVAFSDEDRSMTYVLLDCPPGLKSYRSTLKVSEVTDGNRSFVSWLALYEAEDGKEEEFLVFIRDTVYQGGLDALKKTFGG